MKKFLLSLLALGTGATALLLLAPAARAQFTFVTNNGAITITRYTGSGGDVTIPSSTNGYPVTTIGGEAFYGCSGLTSVTIPNSVTNIGDFAFEYCYGLTSLMISNSITSIGNGAFDNCRNLTNVTIPNSLTSISKSAFSFCINLTSVTIPNSVTSIGDNVFAACSGLTNVTIPSSITNIGSYAFAGCYGLHQVYFQGSAPSVDGKAGSADSTVFGSDSGTAYYLPGTTGWGATFGGFTTAQWYQPQPQILGSDYGLGVRTNSFQFTISWATNSSVVVESSTNLQNWTPVITNTLVSGTNAFCDSPCTNYPQRFYRVRSP